MPYSDGWRHLHCPNSKKKHSSMLNKSSQTWTQERHLLDLVSRLLGKWLLTKFSKATIRCSTRKTIAQLLLLRLPKKYNRQKRSSIISCPGSIENPPRHSFFIDQHHQMRFVSRSWLRKFCASKWWRTWLVRPSYQSRIG